MGEAMSDTPRTDAARKLFVDWKCGNIPREPDQPDGWQLARQLERDLADAILAQPAAEKESPMKKATVVDNHGISVSVGSDGAWVAFKTKSGKSFVFQPIQQWVNTHWFGTVSEWCRDMQERHDSPAPVAPAAEQKPEHPPQAAFVPFNLERFRREGVENVRTRAGEQLAWLTWDGGSNKLYGRVERYCAERDGWNADGKFHIGTVDHQREIVMLPPADAKCPTCGRGEVGELTDEFMVGIIDVYEEFDGDKKDSWRAAILKADELRGISGVKP